MTNPSASRYQEYLRSSHWRRLRKQYREQQPWFCGICNARENLELHHITYERLGAERFADLIPLCPTCHPLLHQLAREGQSGLDPRTIFIAALGRQRREEVAKAQARRTAADIEEEQRAAEERAFRAKQRARYDQRRQLLNKIARELVAREGLKGPYALRSAKRRIEELAKRSEERRNN